MKFNIWEVLENLSREFKLDWNLIRITCTLLGMFKCMIMSRWILVRMRNVSEKCCRDNKKCCRDNKKCCRDNKKCCRDNKNTHFVFFFFPRILIKFGKMWYGQTRVQREPTVAFVWQHWTLLCCSRIYASYKNGICCCVSMATVVMRTLWHCNVRTLSNLLYSFRVFVFYLRFRHVLYASYIHACASCLAFLWFNHPCNLVS